MPTDQFTEFLSQLRSGRIDTENPAFPGQLSAADFVKQVRNRYPVVFQERLIGHKSEFGLARSLQFELAAPGNGQQIFPAVHLFPVFRRCLMISTYDEHFSGIAIAKSVRIRPSKADCDQLVVTMGSGYKLDSKPRMNGGTLGAQATNYAPRKRFWKKRRRAIQKPLKTALMS